MVFELARCLVAGSNNNESYKMNHKRCRHLIIADLNTGWTCLSVFLIGGGAFDVSGGNHVTGILGRPFLSIRLSWFTMTKSGIPQWGIYRKKLELPVTWLVTDRIQTRPINRLQSPAKFTLKSIMIHIEIILAGNGHFALDVWILVGSKLYFRNNNRWKILIFTR